MTVLFHGSFGLHRERMAGILKNGLKNSKITDALVTGHDGIHAS